MKPTPFETVCRKLGKDLSSNDLAELLVRAASLYEDQMALFGTKMSDREHWIVGFLSGHRNERKRPHKVRLEQSDFEALVSGGQITRKTHDGGRVEIILADIGFAAMARAMSIAIRDGPVKPPRVDEGDTYFPA